MSENYPKCSLNEIGKTFHNTLVKDVIQNTPYKEKKGNEWLQVALRDLKNNLVITHLYISDIQVRSKTLAADNLLVTGVIVPISFAKM